ncbi:hypothetical protein, partial [Bacillus cereus group sp. BfR-BA-01318]|uniref:hypothetical protein n=1 Tax=Bacillus cereus group sp. BfR-BA-01318 TaxID=2920295 RepID=UPI001F59047A
SSLIYILTTSESVWRIQLKMYIFIQALMYIFKLAFIIGEYRGFVQLNSHVIRIDGKVMIPIGMLF